MATPMMPPRRRPVSNNKGISNDTYILKDYIGKDDEYIKNSKYGRILVDYETLSNNFELLKKIVAMKNISQIDCMDYESALYLEQNFDGLVDLALVDDYENKDRSYIDTTQFIKHNFYIPMSYFMWNPKFDDRCFISSIRLKSTISMTSFNGDQKLCKETLVGIKEIIKDINLDNLTDLDKCMLVSNYLQSKVQYVADRLEFTADKTYIIDAEKDDVTPNKVGSVNTVLFENYGLCMGIANATTLLLNNPIFNVNVRTIYGDGHAWNLVTIDGKQYYIDNTWAITRNINRQEEALKATSFTDQYMLFGADTSSQIGTHNADSFINGALEEEDYSKEAIAESKKVLSKQISFSNYGRDLALKCRVKRD